jgi:two-component system sensor histidine kinase/response regulator
VAEVLVKPVTPSQLLDVTSRVLGRSPQLLPTSDRNAPATGPDSIAAELAGSAILVVEDNDQNLDYIRLLLEQQQCRVIVARNGVEAVRRLLHQNCDLVLMDLQMPVMDGYAACREIRQQPAFARLPILAMTAHVLEEDRQRCLSAGMNDFIPKPIDPEVLLTTLRRWLPRTTAASEDGGASSNGKGTDAGPPTGFEGILNLNPEQGLERCGGDRSLYRQHLLRFLQQQRGVSRELQESLTAGDRYRAEQQLFRLRLGAEQIGAEAIAQLAAQMAAQLRLGPAPSLLTPRLARLDELLRPLIRGLQERFDPNLPPASATGPGTCESLLGQLRQLLEESDSEACTLFRQHRSLLIRCLGPELGGRLQAAIENYDFPVAEKLLDGVIRPDATPTPIPSEATP